MSYTRFDRHGPCPCGAPKPWYWVRCLRTNFHPQPETEITVFGMCKCLKNGLSIAFDTLPAYHEDKPALLELVKPVVENLIKSMPRIIPEEQV